MLDFEIALARAQARLKIIPRSAAQAIATAAKAEAFDLYLEESPGSPGGMQSCLTTSGIWW
jgi:hypothetical protein